MSTVRQSFHDAPFNPSNNNSTDLFTAKTFTRPNGFARKFGAVLVWFCGCGVGEYPQHYEIYIVCLSFYSSSVYWVVLIISLLSSAVECL